MHLFDKDISTQPAKETIGAMTGQITGNWSINGLPNGGYLIALLANAILKEDVHRAAGIQIRTPRMDPV